MSFLRQAEGSNNIHINYERCEIASGTLTIDEAQVVGYGVVTFDSTLTESTISLPTPIQDALTSIVLSSNTNLQVHGNLIQSNFKVIAEGTSQADAVLVVDFTLGTCTKGHTIELDEDTITIDGIEMHSKISNSL